MTKGAGIEGSNLQEMVDAALAQKEAEARERDQADAYQKERASYPTLQIFLEAGPSGVRQPIKGLWGRERRGSASSGYFEEVLIAPQITLHCETCGGNRIFRLNRSNPTLQLGKSDHFLTYICRNCGTDEKRYSLLVERDKEASDGYATKYGEVPPLGQRLPRKLVKLAGEELDNLRKGHKAELAGMGIAAFAYYRRVLDSQRIRILDEIIAASKLLQADPTVLAELEAAKRETRFTTSVEAVKHGLPQALLIDGHNPLTLLHDALSDGLHSESDEDCLLLATTIRVLMTEILERVELVRSDKAELKAAVANLLKRKAQKSAK